MGAIKRAASELRLATKYARATLESQTGRDIERWNDEPKRIHTEVLALFDAAIHALRQVHG